MINSEGSDKQVNERGLILRLAQYEGSSSSVTLERIINAGSFSGHNINFSSRNKFFQPSIESFIEYKRVCGSRGSYLFCFGCGWDNDFNPFNIPSVLRNPIKQSETIEKKNRLHKQLSLYMTGNPINW